MTAIPSPSRLPGHWEPGRSLGLVVVDSLSLFVQSLAVGGREFPPEAVLLLLPDTGLPDSSSRLLGRAWHGCSA